MISVYQIKPAFQKLLLPVLKGLHKLGVTANQLTVLAVLLSLVMGGAILYHQNSPLLILVVPVGYLLRMALNALDGMMATQYNMQSKLGEVLNELGDVVSDAVIIFPILVLPNVNVIVIILFGVLAIINEFAGVLGKLIGGERRYDGPMGKSDRALVIGLFFLVYYFWPDVELYANWIFGLSTILVALSTITRVKKAL